MIPNAFDPTPSLRRHVAVDVSRRAPTGVVTAYGVGHKGAVARQLGVDRATLTRLGFEGKVGQATLVRGGEAIAVGIGGGKLGVTELRDVGAAAARAAAGETALAVDVLGASGVGGAAAAQAVVEGVLLARYRFTPLKRSDATKFLETLTLVVASGEQAVTTGAARGVALARAGALARDLANSPPSHLSAAGIANVAEEVAAASDLEIEVLGRDELEALGCGGLLGVNAGSALPPRLVKLTYTPKRAGKGSKHLALVGKGIMYDSGGISLKPSDPMHALMKMDMSGAAAVLSAMSVLGALKCTNRVTGYLMCTDNMPSGSAMKLGDVLHIRGGTTVEVHNTDAEGRLVLADGLALATETKPDAIIDIATLTGACIVALGVGYAGVLGNDQELVDRLRATGETTDERLWQLPLESGYRKLLDSDVADLKNIGGPYGGAITAAVFLSEFVGDTPWAHLDIAGPMRSESDDEWRPKGATGFGARTLAEFAAAF